MTPTRKQLWKEWLPALIWLGIIAVESTKLGGADNTSRILYPIFHFLFSMDLRHFEVWHHFLRKAGHFTGYFVLSLLLFRAWRATIPSASVFRWAMRWARVSWLMTAAVATLDEWHQTFIPSRTGRWQDVVLDSSAGLVAQIIIWLLLRRRRGPAAADQDG